MIWFGLNARELGSEQEKISPVLSPRSSGTLAEEAAGLQIWSLFGKKRGEEKKAGNPI